MNPAGAVPPLHPNPERSRILAAALLALGAAALAALFSSVESREVAPVLGVLWLGDLLLGVLLLLLWTAWRWLEPLRRRAGIRWEARLARGRLRRHERLGTLSGRQVQHLELELARRERAALRGES